MYPLHRPENGRRGALHALVARRQRKEQSISSVPVRFSRADPKGMQAVGVMYTAPGNAQPAELDKRVPLSIGVGTDTCTSAVGRAALRGKTGTARLRASGSQAQSATKPCQAAGGYWIPLALGWMTHIYPNETERDKIWIGEQMMMLNAAEVEHNAHKQQKH